MTVADYIFAWDTFRFVAQRHGVDVGQVRFYPESDHRCLVTVCNDCLRQPPSLWKESADDWMNKKVKHIHLDAQRVRVGPRTGVVLFGQCPDCRQVFCTYPRTDRPVAENSPAGT